MVRQTDNHINKNRYMLYKTETNFHKKYYAIMAQYFSYSDINVIGLRFILGDFLLRTAGEDLGIEFCAAADEDGTAAEGTDADDTTAADGTSAADGTDAIGTAAIGTSANAADGALLGIDLGTCDGSTQSWIGTLIVLGIGGVPLHQPQEKLLSLLISLTLSSEVEDDGDGGDGGDGGDTAAAADITAAAADGTDAAAAADSTAAADFDGTLLGVDLGTAPGILLGIHLELSRRYAFIS